MSIDISALLPYGRLRIIEVYFEHDGPRFFALRSLDLDVRLLAICVDEDEGASTLEYLYLVLSSVRFAEVRSGNVSLLEAFQTARPWQIWRVVENYAEDEPSASAIAVPFESISNSDLPLPGARLDLPTATAQPLDEVEMQSLAEQSLRSVAAVELTPHGQTLTEFPLGGLGEVSSRLQDTLVALAHEEHGDVGAKGPVPANVVEDVQMSAMALRAASFALVVGTDKRGKLIENGSRVEATLNRLIALVVAGASDDVLEALSDYGSRARNHFRGLLGALHANQSGLGLITAPLGGSPRSAHMSEEDVSRALTTILAVPPARIPVTVPRGILLGSNTRLKNFELFDSARGMTYSGKVAAGAASQIDGLPVGNASFVSASLTEESAYTIEGTGKSVKYFLEAISQSAT